MKNKISTLVFFFFVLFSGTTALAAVDWVGNMFPGGGSSSTQGEGSPLTIYVQTYKAGTTEPAGQGPGLMCQIYYGQVTNFGDPWMNISSVTMAYNVDIGNNDEYMGDLAPAAGNYEFTCRCSDDFGATWTYADLGGAGNGQLTVNAPAPVELTRFFSRQNENAVELNWQTASEYYTSHFEIARSVDGQNWQAIGKQTAQQFATAGADYFYTDTKPLSGKSYYRLDIVDLDGTKTHSPILVVQISTEQQLKAYPNPVFDQLSFEIPSQNTIQHLSIYNAQGQLLGRQLVPLDDQIFQLNLAHMQAGLYLYQFTDAKGTPIFQDRFIKN